MYTPKHRRNLYVARQAVLWLGLALPFILLLLFVVAMFWSGTGDWASGLR